MNKNSTEGIAIISVLLLLALVMGVFAVMTRLTLFNVNQTGDTVLASRTYAAAQGGRNFGQLTLQGSVSDSLRNAIDTLAQASQIGNAGTWVFAPGTSTNPPPSATVAERLRILADIAQDDMPGDGCYGPYTIAGQQKLSLRVSVTGTFPACDGQVSQQINLGAGRFISGAVGSTQEYSLPYAMVISASEGSARRSISVSGEVRFTVGNSSFARFALLTDKHQDGASARIYFNSNTLFNGPVHTNGNFAFADTPWFGSLVTSAGETDRGEKGGYFRKTSSSTSTAFLKESALGNPNPSYGVTKPEFKNGVSWNAQKIPFPSNSNNQLVAAKQGGLYIPNSSSNSVRLSVSTGESGTPFAGQKVQEITVDAVRYRVPEIVTPSPSGNTKDESRLPGPLYIFKNGKWEIVKNTANQNIDPFNGVIYADGGLKSFSGPKRIEADDHLTAKPAVASFSQMTLVSNSDVRVTGDIKYENNPCDSALIRDSNGIVNIPKCESDPAKIRNVLGMYVSNGKDIKIGLGNGDANLNAPGNVRIHATMMADSEVRVENHDRVLAPDTPRGGCSLVYILGGVIERTYGAFSMFGANSACTSGFGRSFTYDKRMLHGLTPPMFPTTEISQLMGSATVLQYAQTEQDTR